MDLSLPTDLERALHEEARLRNTTPEQLAARTLHAVFASSETTDSADGEGHLADFLGERIGTLHSSEHVAGGARMSERTGKKFADGPRC
jgi:hypothetical protein